MDTQIYELPTQLPFAGFGVSEFVPEVDDAGNIIKRENLPVNTSVELIRPIGDIQTVFEIKIGASVQYRITFDLENQSVSFIDVTTEKPVAGGPLKKLILDTLKVDSKRFNTEIGLLEG